MLHDTDATALYEEAHARAPGDQSLTERLAGALYRDGRTVEADHLYRELLNRNPDNARVKLALGCLRRDAFQDLDEAVEILSSLIEGDSVNYSALLARAQAFSLADDDVSARRDMEALISLTSAMLTRHPNLIPALCARAVAREYLGDKEGAESDMKLVEDLSQ
jgi:tetratricopeptide (TPR) repeat protein